MKRAEINLPYFKQGDDFAHYLEESGGNAKQALEAHAQLLTAATEQLISVLRVLRSHSESPEEPIEIAGDVHWIRISGPDLVIDDLIAQGLVWHDPEVHDPEEEDEGYVDA